MFGKLKLTWLRLTGLALAALLALATTDLTALAQTATPPPSGSNPQLVAPTDVPVDWALLWVFVFFAALALGLLFANWLVRRGTFDEPERRI